MKIALGQLAATDDKGRNRRVVAGLARGAAAQGAEPLDDPFAETLLLIADLNPARTAAVREVLPCVRDRRYMVRA